jgi:hypothetical protein
MSNPKPKAADEIELLPDGWERFRRTVHAAAKMGPQPKVAAKRARRKRRPQSKHK